MTLSYHDVEVEFGEVREKVFNLPFNIKLTCTRVGGWELWDQDKLLAGEYGEVPLKVYVAGNLICGKS